MRIEYLKEFLALAKNLNYRAAAEELFTTDSALSRHITAIEDELGAALFVRNTRNVQLTSIGVIFHRRIATLLNEYDDICREVSLLSLGYKHTLKLSLPYYAMSDYLGQAPVHFGLLHEDISLDYDVTTPLQCYYAVLRGETDAAIMGRYPSMDSDQLRYIHLYSEPPVVLMNENHRLASRSYVTCRDISEENLLMIDTPFHVGVWETYQRRFEQLGLSIREPTQLRQIESALSYCQSSQSVYIMPWHMRHHIVPKTVYVPLNEIDLCRKVCFIYRPEINKPALRAFLKSYETIGTYGWPDIAPSWTVDLNWPSKLEFI